ncbi:MAG: hypothetical protein SF182_06555 [Deltaproteobacteria bacterium]|nr:hypothetical protein [Deltaproteobacteria bacterium]
MGTPSVDRLVIRSPVAEFDRDPPAQSYMLGRPLRGVRVGVRQDPTWRSWHIIAADWVERLRRDGAEPLLLQTGERTGPEGEKSRRALAEWMEAIDCAVVGLGTCGSCTMWSVRDAVGVEQLRKPAVAAVCDEFVAHGRTTAAFLGHPDLKVLVFPYPLEARPDAELRAIAGEWYPQLLALLGVRA